MQSIPPHHTPHYFLAEALDYLVLNGEIDMEMLQNMEAELYNKTIQENTRIVDDTTPVND